MAWDHTINDGRPGPTTVGAPRLKRRKGGWGGRRPSKGAPKANLSGRMIGWGLMALRVHQSNKIGRRRPISLVPGTVAKNYTHPLSS